ncbi:MAG: DNA adenine methylase [Candidatus Micrarchaeales archaeon]|nr:DNA adenine methylase [Candidatus Micrarchaeales archaeon]
MEEKAEIIKSPLRYPGGKSKAVKRIIPLIIEYDEYREPMVGGGSVFFALKQKYPYKKYWINDKNKDLAYFWKACKSRPNELVETIMKFRNMFVKGKRPKNEEGRKLYYYLMSNKENLTQLERAARFFILNRITFSGLVESGGFSKQAFKKRFTPSSIERVRKASTILQGVKITNLDYKKLVNKAGQNTFLFLDPPYMSNAEAKLYGERGRLHEHFRHKRFAENIEKCQHKYLITYDDCSGVQKLYTFANAIELKIEGWKLQYGTNNGTENKETKTASIGKELFIFNYEVKADN